MPPRTKKGKRKQKISFKGGNNLHYDQDVDYDEDEFLIPPIRTSKHEKDRNTNFRYGNRRHSKTSYREEKSREEKIKIEEKTFSRELFGIKELSETLISYLLKKQSILTNFHGSEKQQYVRSIDSKIVNSLEDIRVAFGFDDDYSISIGRGTPIITETSIQEREIVSKEEHNLHLRQVLRAFENKKNRIPKLKIDSFLSSFSWGGFWPAYFDADPNYHLAKRLINLASENTYSLILKDMELWVNKAREDALGFKSGLRGREKSLDELLTKSRHFSRFRPAICFTTDNKISVGSLGYAAPRLPLNVYSLLKGKLWNGSIDDTALEIGDKDELISRINIVFSNDLGEEKESEDGDLVYVASRRRIGIRHNPEKNQITICGRSETDYLDFVSNLKIISVVLDEISERAEKADFGYGGVGAYKVLEHLESRLLHGHEVPDSLLISSLDLSEKELGLLKNKYVFGDNLARGIYYLLKRRLENPKQSLFSHIYVRENSDYKFSANKLIDRLEESYRSIQEQDVILSFSDSCWTKPLELSGYLETDEFERLYKNHKDQLEGDTSKPRLSYDVYSERFEIFERLLKLDSNLEKRAIEFFKGKGIQWMERGYHQGMRGSIITVDDCGKYGDKKKIIIDFEYALGGQISSVVNAITKRWKAPEALWVATRAAGNDQAINVGDVVVPQHYVPSAKVNKLEDYVNLNNDLTNMKQSHLPHRLSSVTQVETVPLQTKSFLMFLNLLSYANIDKRHKVPSLPRPVGVFEMESGHISSLVKNHGIKTAIAYVVSDKPVEGITLSNGPNNAQKAHKTLAEITMQQIDTLYRPSFTN